MKQSLKRIAALLVTALLLCLCIMPAAVAESPTEAPEAKATMTPAQLQAQGILTVGAKGVQPTWTRMPSLLNSGVGQNL